METYADNKARRDIIQRNRNALIGFCAFFVTWPTFLFIAVWADVLEFVDTYHMFDIMFRIFPTGIIGGMFTLGLYNFLIWLFSVEDYRD